VILPNLLNYAGSVAVLDPKLENYRYTSLFRQQHGQQVYLWAPFAEDGRTHRWNMLDAIDRDSLFRIGDILAIAQSFFPSDCHPKDKFWNDNARNLFLALVLYLMETPELPCTLGEVFRQSSGAGKPLKQHLEDLLASRRASSRPLSCECIDAFQRFQSASSETVGNIISTFNAPLLIFANPIVDAATSCSDFDLRQVRRQPMSVYVGIPPHRLSDAGVLANIFFAQLIDLNTKQLPAEDPGLRYECTLVLDELAAFGKLAVLARSNFYLRAYSLRLLSALQSPSQAVARYGEADARTLIADHTLQIAYPPTDQAEAEEYSKMLGFLTQSGVSTSTSQGGGANGANRSQSSSEHARALMLAQELRIMPRHQQILFPRYCRPILCDKARFYEDHRFIDRLKSVSPTLAALDHQGWRRPVRACGVARRFKVKPTQQQYEYAAFVLQELSTVVAPIPLRARPSPATPPTIAACSETEQNAGGAEAPQLPVFNDPALPTQEEANTIVDAFFAQLPLFDASSSDAPPSISTDAQVLQCHQGEIDLSALDR